MPDTGLERIPEIAHLDHFALKLPAEHREKLYEIVEGFLCIGARHEVCAGLASALGTTSKGDKQEEYIAYLRKKANECKVRA